MISRAPSRRTGMGALAAALALMAGACSGHIAGDTSSPGGGAGPPTGSTGSPTANGGGPTAPGVIAPATGQRLTDRQYLNVITDLFAIDATPDTASLPLDPKVDGFRNAASALLPSDVRVEGYAGLAAAVAGKVDWGTRLAFLLWNSSPDDALLDAAAHAQLATASGVHAQVTRMLADPRARRALRDYVDDWLDASKLPSTGRDSDLFPQFNPALAADMR